MASNLKRLCRLCGKTDEVLKDLNDVNNINILKMIQDYLHIAICERDVLPTNVCRNCEEKMVTFQSFVLECYRVQDTLQNIYLNDCEKYSTGTENGEFIINEPDIKTEIKDEMPISNDIILSDIKLEVPHSGLGEETCDNDDVDFRSDSECSDTITLASLRETKLKQELQNRPMTDEQKRELEMLCQKEDAKIYDFIKMKCEYCSDSFKVWGRLRIHCIKAHKKKAIVYCICGYAIRSKSALYRHLTEHKPNMLKKDRIKYNKNNIKASDLIRFVCEKCYREFPSWYKLEKHSDLRHRSSPTVRCICGVTLNSRTIMYKHVQDHRATDVLRCPSCTKTAKTVEELEKHKLRHIPKSERRYQCSSCDKVCSTKDCLRSHEKSHIPIEQRKIYHCDICNLKFTTRASAAAHKRVVHDKIKSYVCDLCGYACGTNGELRQHRAIHSDDKPFACPKCPKAFKTHSNLKTHMDTHEDTSYACYVCSRVLNSRRTLRKHLLVHDDQCTHVCSYCNKAFKRQQTLKVHMSMHTGEKPLACKWCDERFAYASTLRSHRLRAHPDKMHVHYTAYAAHVPHAPHVPQVPQDYIKNDDTAIAAKIDP